MKTIRIVTDRSATDGTVEIFKRIVASDGNVKIIVDARNFGPIRSSLHALYPASGDGLPKAQETVTLK
jgi:hypothetical protein